MEFTSIRRDDPTGSDLPERAGEAARRLHLVGRVFLVFSVIAVVIAVLSLGVVGIALLSKNGRDAMAAAPALGVFIWSMTAWLSLATTSYALRGLAMVIELLAAKV
jgi:hypothetical protein